jgi:molecular chaperone Hsp33
MGSPNTLTAGNPDTVVRAMTNDGAFRVIAARTTETVRGAISAQNARGATARHFGELITGAILVRETMAPNLRVQGILKSATGRGSLVADAHPDGTSRGLVNFGAGGAGEISVGKGALLQMMRTMPNGALHQGVVEVPAPNPGDPRGEHGSGISRGLMAYMQDSEQVFSMIAVACVLAGDTVVTAGGYVVQLLPEVERGPLMVMTERLADFGDLEEVLKSGASPDTLLSELLHGMPFTRLEESSLCFACKCSQLRVVSTLATLPRADIEDLLRSGEVLEIRCDYCGKDYQVLPAQLRSLLTTS